MDSTYNLYDVRGNIVWRYVAVSLEQFSGSRWDGWEVGSEPFGKA